MTKKRYGFLVPVLVSVPYLLLLFILQGIILPRITIFGAKPLIFPLALAGMALLGGRHTGGIFGLASGMLFDMCLNQPTIEYTLIFTLAGLAVGILSETVLVRSFPAYLLTSLSLLVLVTFAEVFPFLFREGAALALLLDVGWRQIAASALFILPFYYFTILITRLF